MTNLPRIIGSLTLASMLLSSLVFAQEDFRKDPATDSGSRPSSSDRDNPSEPSSNESKPPPSQEPGPGEEPASGEPGEEQQEEEAKPSEPLSPEEVKEDIARSAEAFIEMESDKNGVYRVRDEKLRKDWKLKLVQVNPEKAVALDATRSFACADFKSIDGKHTLDLDMYLVKSEEGGWGKENILIHVVDGKPRFRYDKDHRILPVQSLERKKPTAVKKSRKKSL